MKESFKDFLIAGNFKNIPLGTTRKDLTEILGKTPCIIGSPESKYPSVYKYGIVEFFFAEKSETDELYAVMFQPFVAECENGNLQVDFEIWNKALTIEAARNYLTEHKIQFTEQVNKYDDEIIEIKTISGVDIAFSLNCDFELPVYTFFEAQKSLTI